jgi:hypothetical protein
MCFLRAYKRKTKSVNGSGAELRVLVISCGERSCNQLWKSLPRGPLEERLKLLEEIEKSSQHRSQNPTGRTMIERRRRHRDLSNDRTTQRLSR